MLSRFWSIVVAALCLFVSAPAHAQTVEEDETEVLKPITESRTSAKKPDVAEAAKQVLARANQFRKEEGLEPLGVNPHLKKAVQYFADYMARTNRYGHKADDETPADRAKKFGYDYCIIAENIAYAYDSEGFTTAKLAEEFVEGWKASPGHRKNMLDPDVAETAVAVAQGEANGYVFAVQMFGRPKSKALEFTLANESDRSVEYKMGDRTFKLPPGHARTHQVCRPRDLAFQWQGDEEKEQTVQPNDGDRFVVTEKSDGTLELRK